MRRALPALAAIALACACAAGATSTSSVPRLLFPVVGAVSYSDDFGDQRAGGVHQGNDLLAAKRAPAIAVESGTVRFWMTSAGAGCMLYLHGDSGTSYRYIHLNNDLTDGNDNRGKCVARVAYAPGLADGDRVVVGQQIGYVGDSGDANGLHAHLHFEVHPNDGAAVDPYPYLQKAIRPLTTAPPAGSGFTLKLTGTIVTASDTALMLNTATLTAWPSHLRQSKLGRMLTVTVAPDTAVDGDLAATPVGTQVTVWTKPAPPSLATLGGAPRALAAARIELP